MTDKSDVELIALARLGNKDAFGEPAVRHREYALRFAMRLVHEADSAQDLAQEAAIQAYRSIDGLRDPIRFRSWLCGIVWNVCQSHIRNESSARKSTARVIDERLTPGTADDADSLDIVEEHEQRNIVFEAVESLSAPHKEAILLFYFEQLKVREIARQLSVSESVVKVRLNRARKQLRRMLLEKNPELLAERGGITMVKVIIADIARQERQDEQREGAPLFAVVLKEEAGKRALPIWIGASEAAAIAMGLGKFPAIRPMTFDFFASTLRAIGAKIEHVQVVALKENTFYGIVKIHCGETTAEVDARPSDALALAISTSSPIFVAEEVLDMAAYQTPSRAGEPGVRSGMEDILKDIREMYAASLRKHSKQEMAEQNRRLIASVFNRPAS